MTYWKTEHFKALQNLWYRRLEDSGFRDIEEMVGGELELKQTSAKRRYREAEVTLESKEAYFRVLAQIVADATFKNEIDRLILTRYAEGAKIKAICQELQGFGIKRYRGTIRYRIRTYEMQWGLRSYSPKQLNKIKKAG